MQSAKGVGAGLLNIYGVRQTLSAKSQIIVNVLPNLQPLKDLASGLTKTLMELPLDKEKHIFEEKPGAIFLFCLFYALHMVEEFTLGFVEWGDRYFGSFDWTQNLIGNAMFLACLVLACYLYYKNPAKYLWVGISCAMWVLANAFLHISTTLLGGEYSPGVVTATVIYVPGGLYFLVRWAGKGVLTWKNTTLSFVVGAMLLMLIPTFARAVHFHAQLAKLFHLVT